MQRRVTGESIDIAVDDSGDPDVATPVVLLHGFPYDIRAYTEVSSALVSAGHRVIVPWLRGFGGTRLPDGAPRVGQQAALAQDLLALLDGLDIERALLVGYDWGGRAACAVAATSPERVAGLVSCGTGFNIQDSGTRTRPSSFDAEQRHWYWYYLDSARGRQALETERADFCRSLWRTFSPTWRFDDDVFRATAQSFDNPDFVDVVLHSYRYRIGAAAGAPELKAFEQRISETVTIDTPTVVLQGGADAVDPPQPEEAIRRHFTDLRRLATLEGVGHNLPQERPGSIVEAVAELTR